MCNVQDQATIWQEMVGTTRCCLASAATSRRCSRVSFISLRFPKLQHPSSPVHAMLQPTGLDIVTLLRRLHKSLICSYILHVLICRDTKSMADWSCHSGRGTHLWDIADQAYNTLRTPASALLVVTR